MDPDRLDTLARWLMRAGSRRRFLGVLAAPLAGGLLASLAPEDAAAKDRRRRRKQRHKRRRRPDRPTRKACTPKGKGKICAGKCGPAKSKQTCGKTIDCGPCDCPAPCAACFVCDSATRACVVDPQQVGKACGSAGQVCASDGTCACTATSCPACQQCGGEGSCTGCDGCCDGETCVAACPACTICDDGQCTACPGCCDLAGVCQDGDTNAACGQPGGTCAICTSPQTCGGSGEAGACGCTPTSCVAAGKDCGSIDDGCGGTLSCGTCANPTPICRNNICEACSSDGQCGAGAVCCGGACFSGICCASDDCATKAAPDCVGHTCTCASNGNAPCTGSQACCASGCLTVATDPANCGSCGNACSGSTPVCWNGACVCGDVCDVGCQFSSVQAAINARPAGSTIRICAGAYDPITIAKTITLIGEGDGRIPQKTTTLDGGRASRVVSISQGATVTLQGLRISGGFISDHTGAGIYSQGALTMIECTVTNNHATNPDDANLSGGGIESGVFGSLTMTDCTISSNSAGLEGGGISLLQGTHTFTNCVINDNSAKRGSAVKMNNGGTATFTGCTIGPANNSLEGAIVVRSTCHLTLDATTVSGNYGSTVGGINNGAGSVVTLQNGSTVSGNLPNNCVGTITGSGCAS